MPIDSRLIAVERERRRRQQELTQPTAQFPIMAAHQQRTNINPFQDSFNPNPNTVSMQQMAEIVAPKPDQSFLERIGRGAAAIPVGMAGMAEQVTSDPVGFGKGLGQYAKTWGQRLNPNLMSGESLRARAEWGQQMAIDPVGSTLDAAGVVGTPFGLLGKFGGKGIGNKPQSPKIIADAIKSKETPSKVPTYLDSQVTPMSEMQVKIAQERLRRKAQGTQDVPRETPVTGSETIPSTPLVEKPVVAETPMANGTGGETAYQKFIREGGKESEWDAFRNSKNIESRNASTERTVSQWSSGGELSGNDIVNFATSRGEKISEKVRKALQDDDTVVSNKSLTGRGFTRSEAKKLHSEVSMMMNDLAAKYGKPTTAEAVMKKAKGVPKTPDIPIQETPPIQEMAKGAKRTKKSEAQLESEMNQVIAESQSRAKRGGNDVIATIGDYEFAYIKDYEGRHGIGARRVGSSGTFESAGYGFSHNRESLNDRFAQKEAYSQTQKMTVHDEALKKKVEEVELGNKKREEQLERERQERRASELDDAKQREDIVSRYGKHSYKKGMIRRTGPDGTTEVEGMVSGNLGYWVDPNAKKRIGLTRPFMITHNPSGLQIAAVATKEEANVIIGRLKEIGDWAESDPKKLPYLVRAAKIVQEPYKSLTQPDLAAKYGKPTTAEAVVKKAGEKVDRIQLKKLDERIARQQKIMERTKPQWDKQGEIPGPLMTGRSGYKMGKKLDAQNDRMSKAFTEYKQAEREYKSLTQRREAFLRGDVHYNGQPTASSRNKGNYAQSQFDKIEVGDMIDIGGNAPLKVIKKNRATVVTESGGKWSANQIGEVIKKSDTPPPTELHAGVNPFRIMGDALKRVGFDSDKLKKNFANPLGTPEIVLKDTGIVEPFRRETGLMNTALKQAQVRLDGLLKGVTRNSQADMDLFNKLDNPNAKLSHSEQGIRDYLNETLVKINDARKARGQAEIPYRAGYITHLIENMPKEFAADLEIPKSLRFRFAKRKGAYGHKVSAVEALQTYTQAALRDIHVGNALYEASPALEKLTGRKFMWESTTKNAQGQPVTNTFKQIADAPFFTKAGYARSFVERQLGWPTKAARDIEALTGIRAQTTQRAALKVTSTFYNSLLGLALDSGVKNLTQGVHTVAELNLAPTLKGYAKLATPKGFKAAKAEHLLHEFEPFLLTESLPIRSQVGKVAASVLQAPMKFAEFVNRGAAFHAAMDVGIKKGMSPQAAHDFARGIVRKTQFAYGKMDVSPFMQGAVTRPLAQFMTFPAKAGEMLWQYGKTAGERGKLLRYLAVTGAIIMGGKYVGVDMSGIFIDPTKLVDPDSKQGVPLPGSDKRIGIDLSRMGKTGWTPQGVAPVPSIIANAIKYAKEDDPNKKEALGKNTLRSIIPGGRYGGKVYDVLTGDGEVRDSRDRLMRKESGADAFMKLAGFKSTDREVEQSKRESVVEIERDYNMRRQAIVDTIISGDSKKASEMINELLADYPYLGKNLRDTLKDAVKGESKKKEMTSEQRFFNTKTRQLIQANQ